MFFPFFSIDKIYISKFIVIKSLWIRYTNLNAIDFPIVPEIFRRALLEFKMQHS